MLTKKVSQCQIFNDADNLPNPCVEKREFSYTSQLLSFLKSENVTIPEIATFLNYVYNN